MVKSAKMVDFNVTHVKHLLNFTYIYKFKTFIYKKNIFT